MSISGCTAHTPHVHAQLVLHPTASHATDTGTNTRTAWLLVLCVCRYDKMSARELFRLWGVSERCYQEFLRWEGKQNSVCSACRHAFWNSKRLMWGVSERCYQEFLR